MRRPLKIFIIGTLVVGGFYWLVLKPAVRSTVVELGDTGYAVKYAMAWGWGMEERIDIFRLDSWLAGQSGDWIEIWEKAYNSGVLLYRSEDGDTYYFGMKPGVYRFHVSTGQMDYHCVTTDIVSHTAQERPDPSLSNRNRSLTPFHSFIDIEPPQSPAIPSNPPASLYYEDLRFLGMFGVTLGGFFNRGETTTFAPSGNLIEPIDGLDTNCKWSSLLRHLDDF